MSERYFVIGQDGRPHGPLTVDDVQVWIADGRANRFSRVRREDETGWQPLQQVDAFTNDLRPAPAPYSPEPDPATPAATGSGLQALADGFASRAGQISIGSSFSRAWALVSRHFIELAGWSLSSGLVIYLVLQIPRVGWLASLVINSVLTGVLSVVYLGRIRGRRVALADVATAVMATLTNLCLVGLAQTLLTSVGVLLLVVPGLYLAVSYVFALPLAIDKRLHFWTALEISRRVIHRQWWPMFGLVLVSALLLFGGILTYGVGLILAMPLSTAALMYAYEDVFGAS